MDSRLRSFAVTLTLALAILPGERLLNAQETAAPAKRMLAPYGPERFPALYRESLDTFFLAQTEYRRKDYAGASKRLEAFWAKHRPASNEWTEYGGTADQMNQETGLNFGSPPCYYALRMLTDCTRWRMQMAKGNRNAPTPSPVTWTVILVGKSNGIEPTTNAEWQANTGKQVAHRLVDALRDNTTAQNLLNESTWLFREYVLAMTQGRMSVQMRTLSLPNVNVAVHARAKPYQIAEMTAKGTNTVWSSVPENIRATTDWWWILYPSHVPEKYPDFKTTEFITGGMGVGPDGESPCFLIDDRWLTRKPPHLGRGEYTAAERQAYLPQWLQHEFFHHLYRSYPDLKLEVKGHDWFDRATWPTDFVGNSEPDYYHQSLHKRLMKATPPLTEKLRYRPPSKEQFRKITLNDVTGHYERSPVENGYHTGTITIVRQGGRPLLRWKNSAGVAWNLTPDIENGALRTGPDCPYYASDPTHGRAFQITLKRSQRSAQQPMEVEGFRFNGELYVRQR